MIERQLPQSIDAEKVVIGGVLSGGARSLAEVDSRCAPGDMHAPQHEIILRAALEVNAAGKPVHHIPIASAITKAGEMHRLPGGPAYLVELARDVVQAADLRHYADEVRRLAECRRLLMAASAIVDAGYKGIDDPVAYLAEAFRVLGDAAPRLGKSEAAPLSALLPGSLRRLEERSRGQSGPAGLPTGFDKLNAALGGLVGGRVYVIAARPGCGKTSLALQIALSADAPAYVVSLEMSPDDLADRTLVQAAGLDGSSFVNGSLNEDEIQRAAVAGQRLMGAPVWVDGARSITLAEMRAKLRKWRAQRPTGPALFVVDYLQLLQAEERKRHEREDEILARFSKGIKSLALELNMAAIEVAQLNRDSENGDRGKPRAPRASDLRGSGQIEQDADAIMLIHHDENVAHVTVVKNRFGPRGVVRLKFNGASVRFEAMNE